MPQGSDLRLINAVIDAIWDEREREQIPLTVVTRRLFALVESGEHDIEVLKAAALAHHGGPIDKSDGASGN
jgi:hypothetical protein